MLSLLRNSLHTFKLNFIILIKKVRHFKYRVNKGADLTYVHGTSFTAGKTMYVFRKNRVFILFSLSSVKWSTEKKEFLRAYLAHELPRGLCLVLSSEMENKFFQFFHGWWNQLLYKKGFAVQIDFKIQSNILSRPSRLVREWVKFLVLEFVKFCGEQLILAPGLPNIHAETQ